LSLVLERDRRTIRGLDKEIRKLEKKIKGRGSVTSIAQLSKKILLKKRCKLLKFLKNKFVRSYILGRVRDFRVSKYIEKREADIVRRYGGFGDHPIFDESFSLEPHPIIIQLDYEKVFIN